MTTNGVPWSIAPAVESVGMGFRAQYPDHVTMSVGRLRETRGELHGEMTAEHEGSQLYRGSMNLSGMNSRTSAAKYLSGRTNGANLPWPGILEHFCVGVLGRQRQGDPFEFVDGSTYQRRPAPPKLLPILMEGVINLFFGPGDAGKSTLAAGLAVSAATGLPLMSGWMPLRKTPVIVLDWENSRDYWGDLFSGVAQGMGVGMPGFMYRRYHRPLADEIEALSAVVAERNIGMVIVDAAKAAEGVGGEGRDPSDPTMRLFGALAHLGPVTTMMIDHVPGAEIAGDSKESVKPYGSAFKLFLSRWAYELRGSDAEPGVRQLMLTHRKHNSGPMEPRRGMEVRYAEDGRVVRFGECGIEAPELVGRMTATEQMKRLLRQGPLTSKEVAETLDVAWATVRQAVVRHPQQFQKLTDGRIGLAFGG